MATRRSKRERKPNKKYRYSEVLPTVTSKFQLRFPCQVCSHECDEGAIECSSCKKWTHAMCINMTDELLTQWKTGFDFHCPPCTHTNGAFDFSKGLLRLQNNTSSESERLLMETYRLQLPEPSSSAELENHSTDLVSSAILKKYTGAAIANTTTAKSVIGDGNCFYHAASLGLFNTEDHHIQLRYLTALEVLNNRPFYDTNNEQCIEKDQRVVSSEYKQLCDMTIKNGKYSELLHLYALSAAINKPFMSYYPQLSIEDVFSDAYRKKIIGKLALVEYHGTHPGFIPQGNSKAEVQYKRTNPSVLQAIDKEITSMQPHKVFQKLTNHNVSSEAPRDRKQVHNRRLKLKKLEHNNYFKNQADEMQVVISMCGKHPFVQQVCMLSETCPSIILYTKENLNDMINTLEHHPSTIIGVDRTFNLGHVYLTTTVFKHPAVIRRTTEDHPIFQGPMYIHSNATEDTYYQFFSHLNIKLKECKKIIFGSDDETALVNAIETAFNDKATMTRCTRHLRCNLEKYLEDKVGLPENTRKELTSHIFGRNGLSRATNPVDYANKKEEVLNIYEDKAKKYLEDRILPTLEDHVMKTVWNNEVPYMWTNNNTESHNHVLKHQTEWKLLKIPDLITTLLELNTTQYKMLGKSITETGEYTLAEDYKRYSINERTWGAKSTEQKEALQQKFIKSRRPQKAGSQTSTDGKLTVLVKKSAGKKPGQVKRRRIAKTLTIHP